MTGVQTCALPISTGSSLISRTGHFQSLLAPLPLPSNRHLVVPFFSQSMSHLLLKLYPLTMSINSSMMAIRSFFSSSLPHFVLTASLCSLQRCVSSLHIWFLIHNGLVLNPTKTEAICFATNPRVKSLCNLSNFH